MTDLSNPPRPRWYAPVVIGSATVLVALMVAAMQVENNLGDTLLGFFTGFLTVALGGFLLATELNRRSTLQRRDTAALDDLEPLRAASRTDYVGLGSADVRTTHTARGVDEQQGAPEGDR